MDKIISNYLKKQAENLNNLFNIDKQIKQICGDISHSFLDTQKNLNSLTERLKMSFDTFSLAELNHLNDKLKNFKKIELNYLDDVTKITDFTNKQKLNLTTETKNSLTKLTKELKSLENKKQLTLNNTKAKIKELQGNLNKEDRKIEEEILINKRLYLKEAEIIEKDSLEEHNQLLVNYNNETEQYTKTLDSITTKTNSLIDDLEIKYDDFIKKHKQNSLNNRQTFYNNTEVINNQINEINKTYKKLLDENKENLEIELSSLNNIYNNTLKEFQNEDKEALQLFENQLNSIDNALDKLKNTYEEKFKLLKAYFNKDITTINVSFQTEKNNFTNKLNEALTNFNLQKQSLGTVNSSFEKSFLKYKRQIENRLRLLNNLTNKKILERQKLYYKEQLKLGKEFFYKQSLIRTLRFVKDEKKNATLRYTKRKREIFTKSNVLITSLTNDLFNKKRKIIEAARNIENTPLDIQVLLARQLYTNESNLLNLEQNYEKELFLNNKSTILYRSTLEELTNLPTKEIKELTFNYEKNKLNINNYLDVQYQKNIYETKKEELNVTKELNELNYQIKSLLRTQKDDLYFLEILLENEKATTLLKLLDETKTIKETYLNEKLLFDIETLKLKKQKETNTQKALETIKFSALENTNYQKILQAYFSVFSSFNMERTFFLRSFKDIYYNFDKEIFLKTLPFLHHFLVNQHDTSTLILNDLLNSLTKRINESIEAHKLTEFDQKVKHLIDNYEKEKTVLLTELNNINEEIKNLRNVVLKEYREISLIKEEIVNNKSTKTLLLKQIKGLKDNFDAQSKKTISQLKEQLRFLREKDFYLKISIKTIEKRINDLNKQISTLGNKIKPLNDKLNNLDKDKDININILNNNHIKETSHFTDALNNLNNVVSEYEKIDNELLTEFKNKFMSTKLNVTESNFSLLEEQITYLLNNFDKNISETNKTLSIIIEHLHIFIRKEQLKIEQDFISNYQLSLEKLTRDKTNKIDFINNQLKELNNSKESLFKLSEDKYKNNLKLLTKNQKDKLKQLLLKTKQVRVKQKRLEENNQLLLNAFITNKNDVNKTNRKDYQKHLKELKRNVNNLIRQNEKQIKLNLNEVLIKSENYKTNLAKLIKEDKVNRKKFNTSLKRRKKSFNKSINFNNRLIKKLTSKLSKVSRLRDLRINASRSLLIKYQQRQIRKIKFNLRFNLYDDFKEFKYNLKKDLL